MQQIIITKQDSQLVELAFFEYNASLHILSYLLSQKNINEEYLNEYFKRSEKYNIYLEQLKNKMINKYLSNIKIKKYNFNFDKYSIEYEV